MFVAEITASNTQQLETDPRKLETIKAETVPDLMTSLYAWIYAADRKRLFPEFTLTIAINKKE